MYHQNEAKVSRYGNTTPAVRLCLPCCNISSAALLAACAVAVAIAARAHILYLRTVCLLLLLQKRQFMLSTTPCPNAFISVSLLLYAVPSPSPSRSQSTAFQKKDGEFINHAANPTSGTGEGIIKGCSQRGKKDCRFCFVLPSFLERKWCASSRGRWPGVVVVVGYNTGWYVKSILCVCGC